MTDEQKKNNSLLNRLIICMGTSDDLIFWVLTDVLYLSTIKGFTDVEISMVFTGAFWGSLILSFPYFLLIKKIKIQTAMVLNQTLFIIASVMLLLSQSVTACMIAQCVYFIALDSFDIGDILVHDLCRKSAGHRDFVKCRSQRAMIYGILSLGLALLVYPLMQVNGSLPMIIETCMTVASLILIIFIARESKDMVPFTKDAPTAQDSNVAGTPVARKLLDIRNIAYSRITWTYIILAILASTFLMMFVTNGKMLLNDDITMIYGAERAVAIFSAVIIATRVAKIIGNAIPRLMKKKVEKYQVIAVAVISILLIAMVLALLSFSQPQSSPVLVGISLIIVYMAFDSISNVTHYLFLNGLSERQELSAIYLVNQAGNILKAIISSIITLLLVNGTMLDVMKLLTLLAVITLLASIFGLYFYRHKLPTGNVKN